MIFLVFLLYFIFKIDSNSFKILTVFDKKKNDNIGFIKNIYLDPYISEDELVIVNEQRHPTSSTTGSIGGTSRRSKAYKREYAGDADSQNHRNNDIAGNSISNLLSHLPRVQMSLDPIINFKFKQRVNILGACITLGMDYLSDISQWRTYCAVEDNAFRGRFSLRGSELGWAKSWIWNLGLGEENTAKFKLRMGLNLKTYKAYARLRFRTEPISPFDIGEGLSCAGKLPLTALLPVLRKIPLRVEYRLRINTPRPEFEIKRNKRDNNIMLSTGIDKVDLSLDELNFCLEWDERSPVWDIGLVRNDRKRKGFLGFASGFGGDSGTKRPSSSTSAQGTRSSANPTPSRSSARKSGSFNHAALPGRIY